MHHDEIEPATVFTIAVLLLNKSPGSSAVPVAGTPDLFSRAKMAARCFGLQLCFETLDLRASKRLSTTFYRSPPRRFDHCSPGSVCLARRPGSDRLSLDLFRSAQSRRYPRSRALVRSASAVVHIRLHAKCRRLYLMARNSPRGEIRTDRRGGPEGDVAMGTSGPARIKCVVSSLHVAIWHFL